MPSGFHSGNRSLQDTFDTRALADRIDTLLVRATIRPGDRAFIQQRDMFFLATADAEGRPTCSYKGGEPGFVRVVDSHTVAFPNYDGNGMYLSMGNVEQTGRVGLLFVDFERQRREEFGEIHAVSTATSPAAQAMRNNPLAAASAGPVAASMPARANACR